MSNSKGRQLRDDGAVAIIVAVSLVLLFLLTALAIDLGFARADVRHNQSVSDFAATAAAIGLKNDGYVGACQAAVDYVFANSDSLSSDSDEYDAAQADCSLRFGGLDDTGCGPTTTPVTVRIEAGPFTITITSPVENTDPTMTVEGQTITPEIDGTPCDRVKVGVVRDRDYIFAPAGGLLSGSAYADAVGVWFDEIVAGDIASLIVLEQTACNALTSGGKGSEDSGFFVNDLKDSSGNILNPGTIAVDSDGLGGTGSNRCRDGTPAIDNQKAYIWAEGGIGSYALSRGGFSHPTDADPDTLGAFIEPRTRRIGRRSVDWLFNCRDSYIGSGPQLPAPGLLETTPPCPGPEGDLPEIPYIDTLRERIGTLGSPPAGGFLPIGCDSQEQNGTGVERYYVDCAPSNNTRLVFRNVEAVVFDNVDKNIRLIVEGRPNAGTVVYFRNGGVQASSGAADTCDTAVSGNGVCFTRTFVYNDSSSASAFAFNNGGITWAGLTKSEAAGRCTDAVATSGWVPEAACFAPLALWSNGANEHFLAGGLFGRVSGSFFAPNAPIRLSGSGDLDFKDAQFYGRTMRATGNGIVTLVPNPDTGIPEIKFNQGLIR